MILITGATGFVGRHLVKELSSKGYKMRCLVRHDSKTNQIKLSNVELVYGNVSDQISLEDAASNVEAVISMAAILGTATYQEYYNTHVNGASNIVAACKKAGVKRIINVSSTSTLAIKLNDYGKTKRMADDIFESSNLDITTIKPDFIYGPDSKGLNNWIGMIKKLPIIPIIGNGKYRKQPVHVNDVVSAIISALKNQETVGKTYIVANKVPIAFSEMIDIVARELGIKKLKLHIPKFIFMIAGRVMEIRPKPPISRGMILGVTQDSNYSIESTIKELKVDPVDFRDGIKTCLQAIKSC